MEKMMDKQNITKPEASGAALPVNTAPAPAPAPEWRMETGEDGAVIYDQAGTIATIPIDLVDWESNAALILSAPKMESSLKALREEVVRLSSPWMADSRPLLTEIEKLGKERDALRKALENLWNKGWTLEALEEAKMVLFPETAVLSKPKAAEGSAE